MSELLKFRSCHSSSQNSSKFPKFSWNPYNGLKVFYDLGPHNVSKLITYHSFLLTLFQQNWPLFFLEYVNHASASESWTPFFQIATKLINSTKRLFKCNLLSKAHPLKIVHTNQHSTSHCHALPFPAHFTPFNLFLNVLMFTFIVCLFPQGERRIFMFYSLMYFLVLHSFLLHWYIPNA